MRRVDRLSPEDPAPRPAPFARGASARRFYVWFGVLVLGTFVVGFGWLTSGVLSVFFDRD